MRRTGIILALALTANFLIPGIASAQANIATFVRTARTLSQSGTRGAALLAAMQANAEVSGMVPDIAASLTAQGIAETELATLRELGLVEPLTELAGATAAPAQTTIPPEDLAPGTRLPEDAPTLYGTVGLEGDQLVLTGASGTKYRLVDGATGWTAILDQMQPIMIGMQASVRGWPANENATTLMVTEFFPNVRSSDFAVGRVAVEGDTVLLKAGEKQVYVEDPAMAAALKEHAPLAEKPDGVTFNTGTGVAVAGNVVEEGGRFVLRNAQPEVWILTAPNSYGVNQAVEVEGYTVVSGDVPNGKPNQMITYGNAATAAEINAHEGDGTQTRNKLRAMVYGRFKDAGEVPEAVKAAFPETTRFFEALDYRWSQPAQLSSSGFTANHAVAASLSALLTAGLVAGDDPCGEQPDPVSRMLGVPRVASGQFGP